MRCKVGDLAVIVRVGPDTAKFLGRIVKCVRKGPNTSLGYASWEIEHELHLFHGNTNFYLRHVEDACLRPIRDNPGQDESLIWQPHKETA